MKLENHSSRFIEEFYDKDYPCYKLKEIAQVVTGSTPARSVAEYWTDGTHPWVSAQDMGNKYVDKTAECVTDSGLATCKLIPAGSVLYMCRGSIGVMSINRIDCATNQSICSAICDDRRCKSEYLFYWLLYHEDEIAALGEGTSFKSLSQKTFANLEIQLPPIEDQNAFITIAHQADKSKFNGFKSRFIEMFGTLDNPKVPVKRMIEVSNASGQYGMNASAVDYIEAKPRYIRITDICDDGSLNDDIKCSDIDDSAYSVSEGDVLFARTGATVGKTYLHRSGDACFAGYLIRYSYTEAVDPEYVLAYTHSATYYDWVLKSQKVGAQPNISASQYDNMPILIPGRTEQEEFLRLYRQADKSKYLS